VRREPNGSSAREQSEYPALILNAFVYIYLRLQN
jgi:hypothetical protein